MLILADPFTNPTMIMVPNISTFAESCGTAKEESVRPVGMWSTVTPDDVNGPAPSSRSKHSATLLAGNVYLLGGRNGNVPLKDFWKYNLGG